MTAIEHIDTVSDRARGFLGALSGDGQLCHVHERPARAGVCVPWPDWLPEEVRSALAARGIAAPWSHQAEAADAAYRGQHVIVSTGTASGKSLAYLLPVLTGVIDGQRAPNARGQTALYLGPTKALARDQLRAIDSFRLPGVRAAAYDGDTEQDERAWIRAHAHVVLTNPDLLHHSLLPGHAAWSGFLRALRYVVIDECHGYRGVFGSHVANVIRRLRRVAAHYDASPTFILASATASDPAATASELIGAPVRCVSDDGAPRGAAVVALWQPPLQPGGGEHQAPTRRSALSETARMMTRFVDEGLQTLAFTRSRVGAEAVALAVRQHGHGHGVAAYRGGYLPEERRALEAGLTSGAIRGLATTNALELGIDVPGVDAVVIAGWPGTRASLWQQVGRAGRNGAESLGVLVARDDPLDTYLVHNPTAIFGAPLEAHVLDPRNPYVLKPHLAAAAAELPLTPGDIGSFGPTARAGVDSLVAAGLLRERPTGWYWTSRGRASDLANLRGTGAGAYRIAEVETGRLLGTVDASRALSTIHTGAVYLHQGETYLVDTLDLDDCVAQVRRADVDYSTIARSVTDLRIREIIESRSHGPVVLARGWVDVESTVVSYLRRSVPSGRIIDETLLTLPTTTLATMAVWWSVDPAASSLPNARIPGAVHAAEHATIGLLPLVASCDRWDIGGVSSAMHPDTGQITSFVYDGLPGGAGFAERGFVAATTWLGATRDAIGGCQCEAGCPSCVQSPKCGNGNKPLDKAGALILLDIVRSAMELFGAEPPR